MRVLATGLVGKDKREALHRNSPLVSFVRGCSLLVRLLGACGVEEIPQVSSVSDVGLGVTGSGEAAG